MKSYHMQKLKGLHDKTLNDDTLVPLNVHLKVIIIEQFDTTLFFKEYYPISHKC